MKKEEIDKLITESLSKEEAAFYNELEEESFLKGLIGLYKGKHRWLIIITTIVHLISAAVVFYCGYKAFSTTDMLEMMQYGMVMFIALIMASMIKIWNWMQLDKYAIIREMKRLEYQVALLMEKNSERR